MAPRQIGAASLVIAMLCRIPSASAEAATAPVWASAAGARLDSDLLQGGGTDDTAVLQRQLNVASKGKSVHLVIDGPALVSGLNVYGNTTIECATGGGLYLKDYSSRAILRNAHRSRDAIRDERIEVRGCFLNGNRRHQPGTSLMYQAGIPVPPNRESDGTWISGLQFFGVNYLTIQDVTLWNTRAFAAHIANANYLDIRNVLVDHGGGLDAPFEEYGNTDGLHFNGPLRYVSIDSIKVRTGDDALAFNANDTEVDDFTVRNDFGPYVGPGPITDVTVSNVVLMEPMWGIRLLSSNQRIDRIVISNVVGTVKGYLANISHSIIPSSLGNLGAITIANVNVGRLPQHIFSREVVSSIEQNKELSKEVNGGNIPFISVNAHIENLNVYDVVTKIVDSRPILRIGPDAAVQMMDVRLSASDPALSGHILELDEGGHVNRLKFALNWQGAVADEGKNPILSQGGTIETLQWSSTPPLYVEAHAPAGDGSSIDVVFNQRVKARRVSSGARVSVNGKSATVKSAVLRSDGNTVRYQLTSPIKPDDSVTWSYDSDEGDLQNIDGSFLRSVPEKNVRIER